MGQEIDTIHFQHRDFDRFEQRLQQETHLLKDWLDGGAMSKRCHIAGLEAEAWLVDNNYLPLPENERFLGALSDPMVVAELARFNIEINVRPEPLTGRGLALLAQHLESACRRCQDKAQEVGGAMILIGILPTARESDFAINNMSPLNRYRALNEQVLRSRLGEPLMLDISGHEHLRIRHHDVMLESATTSFQLHWQLPMDRIAHYFNASVAASCATTAIAANSPFLFEKALWDESRIPLFEQAVEVGGFAGAAHGPVRRVTFGTGYVRRSLHEFFSENLEHYPALLPICADTPAERFVHARLHNGTIWRWNRPLIGFDDDGCPHARIEHRVMAAGPTVIDQISNAAFYYGLTQWLTQHAGDIPQRIPFATARDNFYAAARHGLRAHVHWLEGKSVQLARLLLDELLPAAETGLRELAVDDDLISRYLGVVEARVRSGRTGAQWQRDFIQKYGRDFSALTRRYAAQQQSEAPVHTWDV